MLWYWCVSAGQTGVIVGACAVLFILLLISGGIVWKICCKRAKKDTYNAKRFRSEWLSLIRLWSRPEVTKVCFHRKVHSAPNKLNTIFQQPDPKDRPQISDPTLMETTTTQACTPLMLTPSRPPPQVQQSTSSQSPLSWEQWTYCVGGFFLIHSHQRNSLHHQQHHTQKW